MAIIYVTFFLTTIVSCVLGLPHPIQNANLHSKCFVPQIPTKYLSVGKTVTVAGECIQITCNDDLTISGLTCSRYFTRRGCYPSEFDHYKEYPDCCPQLVCDLEDMF